MISIYEDDECTYLCTPCLFPLIRKQEKTVLVDIVHRNLAVIARWLIHYFGDFRNPEILKNVPRSHKGLATEVAFLLKNQGSQQRTKS